MTSGSTNEFIFAVIRAGLPARAWSASRLMSPSTASCSPSGATISEFHLGGAFWDAMANFNVNIAGFCIAGLFVLVWAVALTYWRVGKVEDRWSASVPAESAPRRR